MDAADLTPTPPGSTATPTDAQPLTSLSAGDLVRAVLLNHAGVSAITDKIFPVATDCVELPYIVYRRAAMECDPFKGKGPSRDDVTLELDCFAADYDQSIALAEQVRAALDQVQADTDDLCMRSCTLADSSEEYDADAYAQILIFKIRIQKN